MPVMNPEQTPLSHDQSETTYYLTGDQQKIIDTFEHQLDLLHYLTLTRVIVLGESNPVQFAFIKHLVELLKKKHQIDEVFIQCNTEPNSTTWDIELEGFTMVHNRDDSRDARPTIWSKITTSSVVVAPSVPPSDLYQAFKFSGFGLLICTDIDDILKDLRPLNLSTSTGGILNFFYRIRDCGYKVRMPLLEGGESWCAETSIHRVGKGRTFESSIGYLQGWTTIRPAPNPTSIGNPLSGVDAEDTFLLEKPVDSLTLPL